MATRIRLRTRVRWAFHQGRRSILRPQFPGILDEMYSSETLRGSALAIIVGILAGVAAVGFRLLIEQAQRVFLTEGEGTLWFLGPAYIVVLPVVGALAAGTIIYAFDRSSRGSDVAGVIDGVVNNGGRIGSHAALTRATASAFTLGSGGSTGMHGPIVHIGAYLGSFIGRKLGLTADWVRTLVACGAAGGISATFNAPIAGVFFSLEVILGRFTPRYFSFVVLSSVVADTVHQSLLGTSPVLTSPSYQIVSLWEFPFYAILGVAAALVAFVFVTLLGRTEMLFNRLPLLLPLRPALGGLGVGLIGLYAIAIMGMGYETVNRALESEVIIGTAATLLALKIVATSLTLGSGGSGGTLAPTLFMGSMLGAIFGQFLHRTFPAITAAAGAYSLVGMAAVFAGVAHAPITAILIVFEMTRDYRMVLPLMTAVVISTLLSQKLTGESIFTASLRRRGIPTRQLDQTDVMSTVPVSAVMTRDFPTVRDTTTLHEVAQLLEDSGHHGFPVVDSNDDLFGIITLTDVENAINHGESGNSLVRDIATRPVVTTFPDASIHETLVRLGARDVGRIPVVSRSNPKKLVGVLRRHDVVRAYTWALDRRQDQSPRGTSSPNGRGPTRGTSATP